MNSAIFFFIILFIILTIAVSNFILWVSISTLLIITLLIFVIRFQSGIYGIRYFYEKIEKEPVWRFYMLSLLTCFSLLISLKFGGGEPLLVSSLQDVYTPGVQKTINGILFGVQKTNKEINEVKELLKIFRDEYPLQSGRNGRSKQEDNECAGNYMSYGIFATNNELVELIQKATNNSKIKSSEPLKINNERIGKTWLPWKIFLGLFLATMIYALNLIYMKGIDLIKYILNDITFFLKSKFL